MSKRILSVAFFLLAAAIPSSAGPLNFLKTHKQLIARDAIATGIYFLAANTEPCIKPAPCGDTSSFFPQHPTRSQVNLAAFASAGILSGVNHIVYRLDPDPHKTDSNVLGWMATAALTTNEAFDVRSNFTWRQ